MNLDELTIGQAKEIINIFSSPAAPAIELISNVNPFKVGEKYFIRTVTHAHSGKVKYSSGQFLVLENAAWIADTGRFYDAIKNTEFDEIEPFTNDLILNMESIIDATIISGSLPEEQTGMLH